MLLTIVGCNFERVTSSATPLIKPTPVAATTVPTDECYLLFDNEELINPNLSVIRGPLELKLNASVDNRVGETPPALSFPSLLTFCGLLKIS